MAKAKISKKTAAKKPAVKTAAKKTAAKKAVAKKTVKKTAIKAGSRYACAVCGLAVTVDTACGCAEAAHIICCEKPMKLKR